MMSVPRRLLWLDPLKGLALGWIILNHVVERLYGSPYFANPSQDWPAWEERWQQLSPLVGHGMPLDFCINAVRLLGWLGDNGVGLMILASGIGLQWSLHARQAAGKKMSSREFYFRRLTRLAPQWWLAHLLLLLPLALFAIRISILDSEFWASLIGVRITPSQLYYGVPAWWFIGLLIQLYLAFPWLSCLQQRFGEARFLILVVTTSLIVRACGMLGFAEWQGGAYLDAWSRGAIFVTRLPEFALGMSLASRVDLANRAAQLRYLPVWLALAALAFLCSFTLLGNTMAPLLGTLGWTGLFFNIWPALSRVHPASALLSWLGRHSYGLFLAHQFFILALLRPHHTGLVLGIRLFAVGLASVAVCLLLEWLERVALALPALLRTQPSMRFAASCAVGLACLAWALLIAAELSLRARAPEEPPDLGWGERPALEPHPVYGYRLRPRQTTRLRWESYDYTVQANSLGFPGPEYPLDKPAGVLRVFTTGDAFTSAEGVDTSAAWPRLLGAHLQRAGQPAEILNFSVTGYGPRQYAAVVRDFAGKYAVDVVIVALFVNDFSDAQTTNEEFREQIGFDRASPTSWQSIVTCRHLFRWLRVRIIDPEVERFARRPQPRGYALGQFAALQRNSPQFSPENIALVRSYLAEIREDTQRCRQRLIVLLVPSAPQVCSPEDLAYFPRAINLADTDRFDLDQPQRIAGNLCREHQIEYHDLRSVLQSDTGGPSFQNDNMHFTPAGHARVAAFVAGLLSLSP